MKKLIHERFIHDVVTLRFNWSFNASQRLGKASQPIKNISAALQWKVSTCFYTL